MKRSSKERDILKILTETAGAAPEDAVFDRVWNRLEDRLASRAGYVGRRLAWRPWAHPVRWVMAACLCLALTGIFYRQASINDSQEVAEYLLSISNPMASDGHDPVEVDVPVLLSGPSIPGVGLLKTEDDRSDVLGEDGILL
jgi:hypothetical protein